MPEFVRTFFPLIFAGVLILVFGLIEVLLMRLLNRDWWHIKWVRRAAWLLPLMGFVLVIIWGIGAYMGWKAVVYIALLLAAVTFVMEIALMLSLPVSGVMHLTVSLYERLIKHRKSEKASKEIDPRRRIFLKGVAAAVPIITVTTGLTGMGRAFAAVKVYLRPIEMKALPVELEGLRILHLSDLHLRYYVTVDDLVPVLEKARAFKPDMILITGDIADDVRQLPETIRMVQEMNPPLGIFASLGNHEYFNNLPRVKSDFNNSDVPLLVNQFSMLEYRGIRFRVAGIEDPVSLSGNHGDFYRRSIDKTLANAGRADFTLLMSHRPGALDYASQRDINLVLSGHTHGGQIGFAGHSAFEIVWPESYLWGLYQRGNTHLYTTSGMGHWFPFRLGCPAEAPVIELRQAQKGVSI